MVAEGPNGGKCSVWEEAVMTWRRMGAGEVERSE